jgi:hypothetical protein
MIINITPAGVIESTVMYGVVHGIWLGIKWFIHRAEKELKKEMRRERNRIIHNHVKTGHEGRLKHCVDEACLKLRRPVQPLPEQPGLHTES